jgi:hypothetical protein
MLGAVPIRQEMGAGEAAHDEQRRDRCHRLHAQGKPQNGQRDGEECSGDCLERELAADHSHLAGQHKRDESEERGDRRPARAAECLYEERQPSEIERVAAPLQDFEAGQVLRGMPDGRQPFPQIGNVEGRQAG